nr:MAG TPA: hypothetical protein [Caudoviricetes sp.]
MTYVPQNQEIFLLTNVGVFLQDLCFLHSSDYIEIVEILRKVKKCVVMTMLLKIFILYIIEEIFLKSRRMVDVPTSIIILKYFEKKVNKLLTFKRKYVILLL